MCTSSCLSIHQLDDTRLLLHCSGRYSITSVLAALSIGLEVLTHARPRFTADPAAARDCAERLDRLADEIRNAL
jgi:hypothetical protein